jgi:uncharacterized membrane protein
MAWYAVLKVVHILSAIVWIGGTTAFAILVARLVRAKDRATLASMLPQVTRYMRTMAGPASGLVLLSGIAMVLVGRLGFGSLWISLGFLGFLLHGLFGGLVVQRRIVALVDAVAAKDDGSMILAGSRVRQANVIYFLIMASVIAVMVLKPMR